MVEEYTELVYQPVVSYVAVGVPQGTLEGVFPYCSLPYVEHFLPRRISVVARGQIEDWYLCWPVK